MLELGVPETGHIVKGYAVLYGPTLTGRITFVSIYDLCIYRHACLPEEITVSSGGAMPANVHV